MKEREKIDRIVRSSACAIPTLRDPSGPRARVLVVQHHRAAAAHHMLLQQRNYHQQSVSPCALNADLTTAEGSRSCAS